MGTATNFLKRRPFDQFEDRAKRRGVRLAKSRLVPIRRCQDVRMVERGEELRFALEPREALGIQGKGFGEDLDRSVAIQPGVARAIDSPIPPTPISSRTSSAPKRVPMARAS